MTIPIKLRMDANLNALGEFEPDDTIPVEHGGTGASTAVQALENLGAATTAQGEKADSALQSEDMAPVAFSGQFNSLAGQEKLFELVYAAYQLGANNAVSNTDSLGQMLGKLQAQIDVLKNGSSAVKWVPASDAFTFDSAKILPRVGNSSGFLSLAAAKIDGMLWVKGGLTVLQQFEAGQVMLTFKPGFKVQAWVENGSDVVNGLNGVDRLRIMKAGNPRANPMITLNSETLFTGTAINSVPQTINAFETVTAGSYQVFLCLGSLITP